MPDLEHSLQRHDLGHLRIVAELWGIELRAPDARTAISELTGQLKTPSLMVEIIEALPDGARQALAELTRRAGRMPWVQFTRQFGEVREMGPGRRDRLRPDQSPVSDAEVLWYRALIGRAFFETPRGNEEFAYIPDDIFAQMPAFSSLAANSPLGRAAIASECQYLMPARAVIIDHATTFLAAQRIEQKTLSLPEEQMAFLAELLIHAGLLDRHGQPNLDALRAHLEAPRAEALLQLAQVWLHSAAHNDLYLVPHLQPEGEWRNDPLSARRFLIGLLNVLPKNTWWSLSAFVADIHQKYPDFQRPAGDYDSWYLRDARSGEFLRGFAHWDTVDGALIRYLIVGPLHWLGVVDLAAPEEADSPQGAAFRLSGWGAALLAGTSPEGIPPEDQPVHLRSDGRVGVPRLAPRPVRYQIARFCRWDEANLHEYRYRLTPASLERARGQGLKITHLLTLLQKNAAPVPPNIVKALKRWDEFGTEIGVENVVVLRVTSPQILEALRKSRAARFLGPPLGPAAITVKEGAEEKVLGALLEMGFLGEIRTM